MRAGVSRDISVSLFLNFSLPEGSLPRSKGVQHEGPGALCGRGPERGAKPTRKGGKGMGDEVCFCPKLPWGDEGWTSHPVLVG